MNSDIRKTLLYGGLFNLSVLATQLLIMAALINVFAVTFFAVIGAANVDVLGVDFAIDSIGLQYETLANNEYSQGIEDLSNDMGHDKKRLITRMAYAVYLQQTTSSYITPLVCFILLAFATIRYHLIDKNTGIQPNKNKLKEASAALNKIRQSLGINWPIAAGHHTAFYRSTLILSFNDFINANSSDKDKVAQARYIAHHEICHKSCRDVYLVYMVKVITAFNCVLLACFFGLMSNTLFYILIGIKFYGIIMSLTGFAFTYVWYRLFFVNFHYFSRLKEHWADEYALLKTQNFEAAKAAIKGAGDSKLHPAPQLRIDYLLQQRSTVPLQLFLMINLVWVMAYNVPHHFFQALFILQGNWFNPAFMLLNLPLVLLIARKNIPETTNRLSILAVCLMLSLILLLTYAHYFLYTHYYPTLLKSFNSHLWDNLKLYHLWFIAVLIVAQWPRKPVNKSRSINKRENKQALKKITFNMSILVVKLQQVVSFSSIILLTLSLCSSIMMQVMLNSLGKNWLPALLALLTISGIVYANIRNIKRPHVASFVIECVTICLLFVIIIYGEYLTALYQHEANSALLALNHVIAPINAGDFAFVLDAFKLAWLHIFGVGLFYSLRIGFFYGKQRRLGG